MGRPTYSDSYSLRDWRELGLVQMLKMESTILSLVLSDLTNNTSLWRGWNTRLAGKARSMGCCSESNRVAKTFTPKTKKALGRPSTRG